MWSPSCISEFILILGLIWISNDCVADDPLQYYILEELPPNTFIANIVNGARLDIKYDINTLSKLQYKFLTQPKQGGEYFTIEADSGILRTTTRIDRDEVCPLQLECLIKFDIAVQPIQFFQIIKLELEIIDINDNPPQFSQHRIVHHISESAMPGKSFVIPAAHDPDSGANAIQEYELYPINRKFELQVKRTADGTTDLRLVLKEKLDREKADHYEVQIMAYDGGIPPKSGSVIVDVEVQDANDNDPKFENESYEIFIKENLPIGTTVLRVKARDDDKGPNGKILYAFSKNSEEEFGNVFGINDDTGDIFVKGNLDYEDHFIYLLSITANDHGPDSLTATVAVVIHVEDSNDNPPHISINTLTSDSTAQVHENADPGTFVAHISVIDGDSGNNGKFMCSIDNPDFDLAKLYLTEYKVVTARRFDREQKSHYELAITCRDKGQQPQVSIAPIHINIVDENDHSPKFIQESYSIVVKENNNVGVSLLQVVAIDDDVGQNGAVEYAISDNAKDVLSIDKSSGVISSKVTFDHEKRETFSFYAIAEDFGSPRKRAEATVQLTILDLDDERPEFIQKKYAFGLFENQGPGTFVGKLTARDKDSPPFDKFSYSLYENNRFSDAFSIDSKSGKITSKKMLDREKRAIYQLTAVVTSDDDASHSSRTSVTIYIADKNDNSPRFTYPTATNNTVEVSSQATYGYVFVRLQAIDIDTTNNAKLSYHIKTGNNDNTFAIDSARGTIAMNADLTSIDRKEFRLRVVVKDGGEPQRSDYSILKVVVRKDIPFAQASRGRLLSGDNLIIALAFILATLFVAIIIICAIIFIVKRKGRQEQSQREKETQKMLPSNLDLQQTSDKNTISCNNYVTTEDIERMKKMLHSSKGIGSEGSASDVNPNGSCLFADSNQLGESESDIASFLPQANQKPLTPTRSRSSFQSTSQMTSPEDIEPCSGSSSGSIEVRHLHQSVSSEPKDNRHGLSHHKQNLAEPNWPGIDGAFEATKSSAPFLQDPDPENASVGSVSNSDSGRGHSCEEGDPNQRDRRGSTGIVAGNGPEDISPAQRARLLAHQLAIRKKQLASLLTTQQRFEHKVSRWDGAGPSSDRYIDSCPPYLSEHGSLTKLNTPSGSLPRSHSPGIIPSLPYGSLGRQPKLRAAPKLHVHFAQENFRHPMENISEADVYNPHSCIDKKTDITHIDDSSTNDPRFQFGDLPCDISFCGDDVTPVVSGDYRMYDNGLNSSV